MRILFEGLLNKAPYKITHKPMTQAEGRLGTIKKEEKITSPVYFSNISFGYNKDAKFLLNQTNRLICAYSGREMLHPYEFSKICTKLKNKPNVQSAVKYLFQYQKDYMHPIESDVFDMLNSKEVLKYHGNKTFKDILLMEKPDSLERLKQKQFAILSSTDSIIEKMDAPIAEMIKAIRDKTIQKINDDSFSRKISLAMLRCIKTQGQHDKEFLDLIYKKWYALPSSSNDYDAFVVKYSNYTHEQIATRLLSPSEATIEHIIPKSKGGNNSLGNYILVSYDYNNERSSESLSKYIILHNDLDIPTNLQKYIKLTIREINEKNSPLHDYSWYPFSVASAIEKETNGKIKLDISGLNAPQKEICQKERDADQSSKKYHVNNSRH